MTLLKKKSGFSKTYDCLGDTDHGVRVEKRKRPDEDDEGPVSQKSKVDRTNAKERRRDLRAKEGKC